MDDRMNAGGDTIVRHPRGVQRPHAGAWVHCTTRKVSTPWQFAAKSPANRPKKPDNSRQRIDSYKFLILAE
ncbi:hypothetical protein [Burkholderia stagnalis]|uniref:hypothetical protein n=1 Tax=Burkholderia stagnalis TaxID=1503054 RepID=UPI000F807E54|nr:hypothetical protein [Burkholderia stagnalis]